jgi:Uma2 family endonuclease
MIPMAMAARKMFTYADFLRFRDDGNRHEVIEGEWILTPPPTTAHQRFSSNLHTRLGSHVQSHDLGVILAAPVGVVLSRTDVVQPDLLFLSKGRRDLLKKDAIHGAPDLAVEILSPSTSAIDRGTKLALYRRCGVREYWIADLAARTVEVHEFGRSRRTRIHVEGQSFESALFPGLKLRVDDLFAGVR